jgi:hypothetical protein
MKVRIGLHIQHTAAVVHDAESTKVHFPLQTLLEPAIE